MRHSLVALCTLATVAFAGEPTPPPEVRFTVNGALMKNGSEISVRPGEKLAVKARVYGARRAWCMEPARFANLGEDTKIETSGEDGLTFSTGPGFKGAWKLKSEIASWWGQLANSTMASPSSNAATITVPTKLGKYALQVKVTATWDYERRSEGKKENEPETNEAEGNYTLVVEQPNDTWFASANIRATGSPDEDLRGRLKKLQERFDLISKQVLGGKFDQAGKSLEGVRELLAALHTRIEKVKKKKPEFDCTITFLGTPLDQATRKVAALTTLIAQWNAMQPLVTANVQSITTMLGKPNFTHNGLKSVVKNYLEWGFANPPAIDFAGSPPVNLQMVLIPPALMDWYAKAEGDASVLKDHPQSLKWMTELQGYYQLRADRFAEESRKIQADLDKNKPVAALENRARELISTSGFASQGP